MTSSINNPVQQKQPAYILPSRDRSTGNQNIVKEAIPAHNQCIFHIQQNHGTHTYPSFNIRSISNKPFRRRAVAILHKFN